MSGGRSPFHVSTFFCFPNANLDLIARRTAAREANVERPMSLHDRVGSSFTVLHQCCGSGSPSKQPIACLGRNMKRASVPGCSSVSMVSHVAHPWKVARQQHSQEETLLLRGALVEKSLLPSVAACGCKIVVFPLFQRMLQCELVIIGCSWK